MAKDTFTSREFPNPKNITVTMPVDKVTQGLEPLKGKYRRL